MIVHLISCSLDYNYHIDITFNDDHILLPVTRIILKDKASGEIYVPEIVKDIDGNEFKVAISQLVGITGD